MKPIHYLHLLTNLFKTEVLNNPTVSVNSLYKFLNYLVIWTQFPVPVLVSIISNITYCLFWSINWSNCSKSGVLRPVWSAIIKINPILLSSISYLCTRGLITFLTNSGTLIAGFYLRFTNLLSRFGIYKPSPTQGFFA